MYITEETEDKTMDEQAFDCYKEGINAELHGQKEKAYDELTKTVILDCAKNNDFITALERAEKSLKKGKYRNGVKA